MAEFDRFDRMMGMHDDPFFRSPFMSRMDSMEDEFRRMRNQFDDMHNMMNKFFDEKFPRL